MSKFLFRICFCQLLLVSLNTRADRWVLENEWSDINNPHTVSETKGGEWTYQGGAVNAPYLYDQHIIGYSSGDFSLDQPAWVQTGEIVTSDWQK